MMIKIEITDIYGWEAAIRGLRNPLNSWAKSDSEFDIVTRGIGDLSDDFNPVIIGPNDLDLMKRMIVSSEQSKYRRMITVTFDTIAPLYWYKEMDTYKVGTVCNSCSTMHTIHKKEFEPDDFSTDHLLPESLKVLFTTIRALNELRDLYLGYDGFKTKYGVAGKKDYWYQMIQLLPSSYNQRRTYQMNYEVLASIYRQRKNHKLDEWHVFCDWIKSLPYAKELITGEE